MSTSIDAFKPSSPLITPVLFLIFNRLDTTKKVFEIIRQAKPEKLYIASDAGRNEEEKKRVAIVRDYIIQNIDWDCEYKTLFREENLGCKYAVSSAIDWIFENEEMGIILEDDCLPSLSFFWYCQEMLFRYKDDLRIWHITGNNLNEKWQRNNDESYYFGGVYASIWGWATWRNRWDKYDVEMTDYTDFVENGRLKDVCDGGKQIKDRHLELKRILTGLDTWDFQWTYARWKNNGLSVNPSVNMIQNIGFGEGATHTKQQNDERANMKFTNITFPLKHPKFIIRDSISETKFYHSMYRLKWIDRIKVKIKRILGMKI